jgi:hypothetical protein
MTRNVMNRDNVGMVQRRSRARLPQEALLTIRIGFVGREHELNGNPPPEASVHRSEHSPHSTRTDQRL